MSTVTRGSLPRGGGRGARRSEGAGAHGHGGQGPAAEPAAARGRRLEPPRVGPGNWCPRSEQWRGIAARRLRPSPGRGRRDRRSGSGKGPQAPRVQGPGPESEQRRAGPRPRGSDPPSAGRGWGPFPLEAGAAGPTGPEPGLGLGAAPRRLRSQHARPRRRRDGGWGPAVREGARPWAHEPCGRGPRSEQDPGPHEPCGRGPASEQRHRHGTRRLRPSPRRRPQGPPFRQRQGAADPTGPASEQQHAHGVPGAAGPTVQRHVSGPGAGARHAAGALGRAPRVGPQAPRARRTLVRPRTSAAGTRPACSNPSVGGTEAGPVLPRGGGPGGPAGRGSTQQRRGGTRPACSAHSAGLEAPSWTPMEAAEAVEARSWGLRCR